MAEDNQEKVTVAKGMSVISSAMSATTMEWIRAQGMWAALFVALVSYAKPTVDRFVDTHFELVETLKADQRNSVKMLEDIKSIVERSEKMWRETIESNRQIMRELNSDGASKLMPSPTQIAIPSLNTVE